MKDNTLDIVTKDLCIGCGACAAICPQGALSMKWDKFGEYKPMMDGACNGCGLCLKVCPFSEKGDDEDVIGKKLYGEVQEMHHRVETGYYLSSYVGYSREHRSIGASGGMATWILESLIAEDIIDHVICVTPVDDLERPFMFTVLSSPSDVRTGASSAYHPVEMSEVLKMVIDTPGRYAITGLPCFIKAVRLAQQRNEELRERIVVTVGLACGQLKSRHFTEYIASVAGIEGGVSAVRYRGKSPDRPATDFHFAFATVDGKEHKIHWSEGISEAWTNRWFTPNACNYCDDVFAECADVTCMDAWLPQYSSDSRGNSIVLTRSPLVQELIDAGRGSDLAPIPMGSVVRSQAGVVEIKRTHLAHRLYEDVRRGRDVPKKRMAPARSRSPLIRQEVKLKEEMRIRSRELWGDGITDPNRLRDEMHPHLRWLKKWGRLSSIIVLPMKALRYLRRECGGADGG